MANPSYSEVERKIRFPLSAMNPTICTQSKTKGLFAKRKPPIAKRKPGNRFVMHPPGTVGAFSLCGFWGRNCFGHSGDGGKLENCKMINLFPALRRLITDIIVGIWTLHRGQNKLSSAALRDVKARQPSR